VASRFTDETPEPEAGRDKLELLLHLIANLPRSILLLAPAGADKTGLLRQVQARAHAAWTVCYLVATPNHGYERILDEMLLVLRRPGQALPEGPVEAVLAERLASLESQGRALVLLLDDAGVLMPGLLSALCQFARLHAPLKLVFSLSPEEMAGKAVGDALALADAHVVRLPEREAADVRPVAPVALAEAHAGKNETQISGQSSGSRAAPPHVSVIDRDSSRRWIKPGPMLLAGGVVIAAVAGMVTRSLWEPTPPPVPTAASQAVEPAPAPKAEVMEPAITPSSPPAEPPTSAASPAASVPSPVPLAATPMPAVDPVGQAPSGNDAAAPPPAAPAPAPPQKVQAAKRSKPKSTSKSRKKR
jgi:hypothetical protein